MRLVIRRRFPDLLTPTWNDFVFETNPIGVVFSLLHGGWGSYVFRGIRRRPGALVLQISSSKWIPKAKWQFTDIFGYRQVMDQYFRLFELEYRLEFFLRIDAVSHGRKTNRR
jgi:hypothetical protein